MKVYVVSKNSQVMAVCANSTLARKKVLYDSERLELFNPEIRSSEDEWEKEFYCNSEDAQVNLALHRDDYPEWDEYTYTSDSGNKTVYLIEAVEMTGDPALVALAEIKRELDLISNKL